MPFNLDSRDGYSLARDSISLDASAAGNAIHRACLVEAGSLARGSAGFHGDCFVDHRNGGLPC